ncbi:MAG: hypothetical protein VCC99_09595, partial [Alphaproteobacteria bacterium]
FSFAHIQRHDTMAAPSQIGNERGRRWPKCAGDVYDRRGKRQRLRPVTRDQLLEPVRRDQRAPASVVIKAAN